MRSAQENTRTLKIATKATDRAIELLGKYRSRLVADVVTGKLDERAAAAALPETAEQLDIIDETVEAEPDEEALDDVGAGEIEEAAA